LGPQLQPLLHPQPPSLPSNENLPSVSRDQEESTFSDPVAAGDCDITPCVDEASSNDANCAAGDSFPDTGDGNVTDSELQDHGSCGSNDHRNSPIDHQNDSPELAQDSELDECIDFIRIQESVPINCDICIHC